MEVGKHGFPLQKEALSIIISGWKKLKRMEETGK